MELFRLFGSIFVDNEKANKSIHATEEKASGLANSMTKGVGTAAKWGAGIAAAGAAGAGALFATANKAAEATDKIDKMSQKIGISRQAYQEYSYILGQNGADVDKLQVGMKNLTQRMSESAAGTGKGAEAFERLGVSATNLDGSLKSQEQVFEEITKKLMELPPGAEKSQLAFELFGKAGQDLMPMLNGTASDFDKLKQSAHDMGLVMSDETIAAGVKFGDTLDDVKKSLGAVVTNIGAQLLPIFQAMLEWVMAHMPEIQAIIKTVFEGIGIVVNVAIDIFKTYLLPVFEAVVNWVVQNWPTIQSVIEGVFNAIKFVWENVLSPVLHLLWDVIVMVVNVVKAVWPVIQTVFETVFGAIKLVWENVLKPVFDFFVSVVRSVVNFVSENFPGVGKVFSTAFELIGSAVSAVVDFFKTLVGWIKSAWEWLTKWNDTPVEDKSPKIEGRGGIMYGVGSPAQKKAGPSKHAKKGKRIRGKHADGLSYVPFDGYLAELHKGERVLTAKENTAYNEPKNEAINLNSQIVEHRHSGTIRVEGYSEDDKETILEVVMSQLREDNRL